MSDHVFQAEIAWAVAERGLCPRDRVLHLGIHDYDRGRSYCTDCSKLGMASLVSPMNA